MAGRTLLLSMRDLKALLTMEDCVGIQEDVFRQHGEGTAWNGENAWIYPDSDVMTYPGTGKMMSGGIEPDWWGMKLLGTREGDPDARGRMQILALFRAETLLPVALMEANYLGHMRTGAGAAVATRHLARPDAAAIGVLGTGATARFALWAHAAMGWPVTGVKVFSRSEQRRQQYVSHMGDLTGYAIQAVDDPKDAVSGAEILITGTGSHEPAFDAAWVSPGTHINAMGQRQEIPPELFTRTRNIGDDVEIATADGKMSVAIAGGAITVADAHASLGDVVAGTKPGRTAEDEITILDSSGLTIQDIAVGVHAWELAGKQGLGDSTELHHDDPLW